MSKNLVIAARLFAGYRSVSDLDFTLPEDWKSQFQLVANGEVAKDADLKRWNAGLELSTYIAEPNNMTAADVAMFVGLHKTMAAMPNKKKHAFGNLSRWFDFVQSQVLPCEGVDLAPVASVASSSQLFTFDFSAPATANKGGNKGGNKGKQQDQKKGGKDKNQGKNKKKDKPKKAPAAAEPMIFHMDIRVGKVLSCIPHPVEPDKMLVSQVDVGEDKPRCVVSAMAKYYTPEQFVGKVIVLVINLPPADIKGTHSNGRAFAATSADGKVKEMLEVPEGAVIGEKIQFTGVVSPPAKAVGKKQNNKIFKQLTTNGDKIALYKDLPFMSSKGPCTAPTVASGTVA